MDDLRALSEGLTLEITQTAFFVMNRVWGGGFLRKKLKLTLKNFLSA